MDTIWIWILNKFCWAFIDFMIEQVLNQLGNIVNDVIWLYLCINQIHVDWVDDVIWVFLQRLLLFCHFLCLFVYFYANPFVPMQNSKHKKCEYLYKRDFFFYMIGLFDLIIALHLGTFNFSLTFSCKIYINGLMV